MSMPCPTWNSPAQSSPRRPSASSRSSITVTSQPAARRSSATELPTRPHPMTMTFTATSVAQRRLSQPPDGAQVTASSSSSTRCGKATISTSHGACRSTKSTVGEKKRDCRRQRGEEPSTIRSAPVARA